MKNYKEYDNLVALYGHGEPDVELLPTVQKLASQNEFPKIVSVMLSVLEQASDDAEFVSFLKDKTAEVHNVLKKAAELAEKAPLALIHGVLNVTVCLGAGDTGRGRGVYGLTKGVDTDFYGITPEYWGASCQLSCFIAKAVLKDISAGINVENPTREDLLKSELMNVWKTYRCPTEIMQEIICH